MKPHILWLRNTGFWGCYMPKSVGYIGIGFTQREAYYDWKFEKRNAK